MNAAISLWLFLVYFVSSVSMLWLFAKLYMYVTPYDEIQEIKDGKKAPAIALAGAMIGFVLPIASMSYHSVAFLDYVFWSFIAGCLQLACFKFLYRFLPREIESDNQAVAIFYAGASICIGVINAFSLIP